METGLSKREAPGTTVTDDAACAGGDARHAADCALEAWLSFLGHRWNALILWQLDGGAKRFSELEALLPGISPKVLTERLSALAGHGLVSRSVTATFPRGTRYALTAAGRDLAVPLRQLYGWAREQKPLEG